MFSLNVFFTFTSSVDPDEMLQIIISEKCFTFCQYGFALNYKQTVQILMKCRWLFPIGILRQMWYLVVSIPDLCTLTYFYISFC